MHWRVGTSVGHRGCELGVVTVRHDTPVRPPVLVVLRVHARGELVRPVDVRALLVKAKPRMLSKRVNNDPELEAAGPFQSCRPSTCSQQVSPIRRSLLNAQTAPEHSRAVFSDRTAFK